MFDSVILPRQVYYDNSGSYYELPVLHTENGHFDCLLDYCLKKRNRSTAWKRKLVFNVQLFLEYMHANRSENDAALLFRNFASALETGTFNAGSGHDPSRLGWRPRTPYDAQQIITRLSEFLEWLSEHNPGIAPANPRVPMTSTEKYVRDCAETYKRKYKLLGHLWRAPSDSEETVRAVAISVGLKISGEAPAFPDDRFEELLDHGFKVGGRVNYRDQAITLLMHGAGFRVSEPLHLFIGDVTNDPNDYRKALVRIHHPELGDAPNDLLNERGKPVQCNRREYLQRKFGLAPRVDLMSKREAGWKSSVLDGKYYMQPFWFKPDYAEKFLDVWTKYMEQVVDIPPRLRRHPYAFMNIYRETKGAIYTHDKFEKSHGRACERIGLSVAKRLGTTPHGHRHAYGRRLARAGIEPSIIMKCMHHATEQSQAVYTTRTTAEVLEALEAGLQRMQNDNI